MKPTISSLSEEIVRWGFEVSIKAHADWFIAFTNPTAGPWKRIMAPDISGKQGEVHRFEVNETRPDLVLVSDTLAKVLIIEAKTSLADLARNTQIQKTAQMYNYLARTLQSKQANRFWGPRSEFTYSLGLLWGGDSASQEEVGGVCMKYIDAGLPRRTDVICIVGSFANETLSHQVYKGDSGDKIDLSNF